MSPKTVEKVVKLFGWMEGAFKKYPSIIGVILVAAFIAWPLQIHLPKEAPHPRRDMIIDSVEKQQFNNSFSALAEPIQERAKKLGNNYTPAQYYEDMKIIELWVGEQSHYDAEKVNSVKSSLHNMMTGYEGIRYWDDKKMDELNRAASKYEAWHDKAFPKEKRKVYTNAEIMALAFQILRWLLIFWLRAIPIIAFLYLNRMAKRSGILESLLQDRSKFILAVVLWPMYFWRYPHWIYREIIVEAELRRMKNPFRQMTKGEQKIIREVAASGPQFKNWRQDFRLENHKSFQRGFAFALLVTIMITLFVPSLSKASGTNRNKGSTTVWLIQSSPNSAVVADHAVQTDQGSQSVAILAREFLLIIPSALQFVIYEMREVIIHGPARAIFHVPILSPVVTV